MAVSSGCPHRCRSSSTCGALAAKLGRARRQRTGGGDNTPRRSAAAYRHAFDRHDNYFDVLGVPPIAGRTFLQGEEDRAPVVVITRQFWVNRLLSDPNAVGRTLTLDSRPYRGRRRG
jgi:hypothetical protein